MMVSISLRSVSVYFCLSSIKNFIRSKMIMEHRRATPSDFVMRYRKSTEWLCMVRNTSRINIRHTAYVCDRKIPSTSRARNTKNRMLKFQCEHALPKKRSTRLLAVLFHLFTTCDTIIVEITVVVPYL